jgi:hypothetical protein
VPGKRSAFYRLAQDSCEEHFGWALQETIETFALTAGSTDDFIDFVEILIETGSLMVRWPTTARNSQTGRAWTTAEDDFNRLFERHRFGFRIEDSEVHQIGSPVLDETVVGPALLAVKRAGWDEVARSYREALLHQRGADHENDDALTAASAALEAALKAQGYRGKTLGELAKDLRKRGRLPGPVQGLPDVLDKLLKVTAALRNTMGDAHGKVTGTPNVPDAIVDLTIHMVGAFLVYLSETPAASD